MILLARMGKWVPYGQNQSIKHFSKNDKIKLTLLYGPIWAFQGKPIWVCPYRPLMGPMWAYSCGFTQNGPRWVTHNSAVRKNTSSYVSFYFQLNFVLTCDHLELNCYYLVKTVIDRTPTLPHETHMGYMW